MATSTASFPPPSRPGFSRASTADDALLQQQRSIQDPHRSASAPRNDEPSLSCSREREGGLSHARGFSTGGGPTVAAVLSNGGAGLLLRVPLKRQPSTPLHHPTSLLHNPQLTAPIPTRLINSSYLQSTSSPFHARSRLPPSTPSASSSSSSAGHYFSRRDGSIGNNGGQSSGRRGSVSSNGSAESGSGSESGGVYRLGGGSRSGSDRGSGSEREDERCAGSRPSLSVRSRGPAAAAGKSGAAGGGSAESGNSSSSISSGASSSATSISTSSPSPSPSPSSPATIAYIRHPSSAGPGSSPTEYSFPQSSSSSNFVPSSPPKSSFLYRQHSQQSLQTQRPPSPRRPSSRSPPPSPPLSSSHIPFTFQRTKTSPSSAPLTLRRLSFVPESSPQSSLDAALISPSITCPSPRRSSAPELSASPPRPSSSPPPPPTSVPLARPLVAPMVLDPRRLLALDTGGAAMREKILVLPLDALSVRDGDTGEEGGDAIDEDGGADDEAEEDDEEER